MLRDTLKTLLALYGPSGRECGVAETVKTMLKAHVDSMRMDALGNLIVEKTGTDANAKRVMFAAHMDHIGYVVTHIEDEGYLRVTNVGGLGAAGSDHRAVVFENGVQGVVVCQPLKGESAAMKHLFIDIGAQDKADALTRVNLGDMAVFAPNCMELGEYRVASPAMDDRCACALLCELLMAPGKPKNTIIGVFSTQEELGIRGAKVAAYSVAPDMGVGIDVTAWGDTPETKIPAVALGKGAAIKYMDRSMVATPCVRDTLIRAAEEANVPYQREVLPFGGTDGAAIQHSRAGVPAGTLSIPCRYVHSPAEVIDMRDMDSALAILLKFVEIV